MKYNKPPQPLRALLALLALATLSALPAAAVTVTLDPQGGSLAAAHATLTVTPGQPYGTLPVPSKPKAAFLGWWTMPDGTGALITPGVTVATEADAQTLYAKWAPAPAAAIAPAGEAAAASTVAASGTWHFTGLDVNANSSDTTAITRTGTVTVAADGALTFSWDSSANLTLEFDIDARAPARVADNTDALAASDTSGSVTTNAKLLKIDNDTWILQTVRQTQNNYFDPVEDRAIIAGVLHRNALPTPNASAWTRTFNMNSVNMNGVSGNEIETEYIGAIREIKNHNGDMHAFERGEYYYSCSNSDEPAIYDVEINYDVTWDADGAIKSGEEDSEYYTRTWWGGDIFHYTETDESHRVVDEDKWENGEWYHFDDNSWGPDSDPHHILSPSGDFYVCDEVESDYIDKILCFQLPGNRLAVVEIEVEYSFSSRVDVESDPFGGDGLSFGSPDTGGDNSSGDGGGGGGAPLPLMLALFALALAGRLTTRRSA